LKQNAVFAERSCAVRATEQCYKTIKNVAKHKEKSD